jgi:hypothetical protein
MGSFDLVLDAGSALLGNALDSIGILIDLGSALAGS